MKYDFDKVIDRRKRVGDICFKIHCDLIHKNHNHMPFASIYDKLSDIAAICNAPSKTFNLARLQISNIIIKNKENREKFRKLLDNNGLWVQISLEWKQLMQYIDMVPNGLSTFNLPTRKCKILIFLNRSEYSNS